MTLDGARAVEIYKIWKIEGFFWNGKKEGLCKGVGINEWASSHFEANFKNNKKDEYGEVYRVNHKLGWNEERKGYFWEDCLYSGFVTGDKENRKNKDIRYDEGVGEGTYYHSKQKCHYSGGFIDTGDNDEWHERGIFKGKDWEIKETLFNRGV